MHHTSLNKSITVKCEEWRSNNSTTHQISKKHQKLCLSEIFNSLTSEEKLHLNFLGESEEKKSESNDHLSVQHAESAEQSLIRDGRNDE